MSNEAFVEKAVKLLYDLIAGNSGSNFTTQLRAIETEQNINTNSIPNPVDYVAARIPNDNRSPLIAIYDEGFSLPTAGQRHGMVIVECTIIFSMVAAGASQSALTTLEANMRRYVTAMIRLIRADPYASGQATGIEITDGDSATKIGDNSATRMVYALGVRVRVQST